MAVKKVPRVGRTLKERAAQKVLDTLRENRRKDILRVELLTARAKLTDANQNLRLWEKLQRKRVLHPAASKERNPVSVATRERDAARLAYELALARRKRQLAANKKGLLALESKAAIKATKWAYKNRPGRSKKRIRKRS